MKLIKKVLYINANAYLHCDHDAFVITQTCINETGEEVKQKHTIPALDVEQIIIFGQTTVSSYLLGHCNKHGIALSYISEYGTFYGKLCGSNIGNVLLRMEQYKIASTERKLEIAKSCVLGKSINQKNLLINASENAETKSRERLIDASCKIGALLGDIAEAVAVESLRGVEGSIASIYFSAFDDMIKRKDTGMEFIERSKRPPENCCNAALSLLYTILISHCVAALESFGLEPYLGFLHEVLPGRKSLACDLVEEFRAPLVDHFILNLINRKQLTKNDFVTSDGDIRLKDACRKRVLLLWEQWKSEKVYFPLYEKEVERKMLPYLQAQLLAQYIRGDIPEYPPYVWEVR